MGAKKPSEAGAKAKSAGAKPGAAKKAAAKKSDSEKAPAEKTIVKPSESTRPQGDSDAAEGSSERRMGKKKLRRSRNR